MTLVQGLLDQIPSTVDTGVALMVYGSEARGEAGPDSDLDLLRVVRRARRSEQHGRAQVSSYTMKQLDQLGRNGSLFLLHIITDGIPLVDPSGVFPLLPEMYRRPASYEYLFADLRSVLQLINVEEQVYMSAPARFERILVFASRSYLYARAAETRPCFSLPQIASRGSALARSVVEVRAGNVGYESYQQLVHKLSGALGYTLRTPHPSLESATRGADLSSGMVCRFVSDLGHEAERGTGYTWLGK